MDDDIDSHPEDVSIASSIPTDLSISEISDLKIEQTRKSTAAVSLRNKKQNQREKERCARLLLEKKQIEHDLQLVKIELNQKEYLLENVRTEYKLKIEDLEEKLNEYKHQKRLLVAKTESQLNLQQDEAKRKQGRLQADLSVIKVRLRELEAHNESLMNKSGEIKQQLRDHADINEDRYYELRSTADELVTVQDLVAMRIFEALRPYKIELDELKSRCERMSGNLKESDDKATSWKQELDEERQQHALAQVKLTRLITESQELEAKATNKDYRINNYDRVNRERDELERTVNELRERNTVLEREFSSTERDRKHFEQEFVSAKSALTLITQDKEYLTRQICELTNKLAYSEERLQRQTAEVDEVKRAREELFEKYISSRDQYKTQYEQQLQAELRQMSTSTQDEVEKLRATTRAMYDMEARTLRESRDTAVAERDKAVSEGTELQTRYHQLQDQYRQAKLTLDTQLSEIRSEMKMAEYERSRTQLLQDETSKNLKDCQVENEKMLKKLEVANKEYYNLEMRYTKKCTECDGRIREYQTRLEAYENIEKELDEIIMQAAEVDGGDETSEKVMLSYGYGASIPSSSQRRMKQSVHLARRCLALERQMVGDKRQIKELEAAIDDLKEELGSANGKLETAEHPYSYILNKTQELEHLNRELRKANHTLEVDVRSIKKKFSHASGDIQKLTLDLERSANNAEEMAFMKSTLSTVIARSAVSKKAAFASEMSDMERILKAKKLLERGTDAALREAEVLLAAVDSPCNPASSVLNKQMTMLEAVSYIDSLLLGCESPYRHTAGVAKALEKSRSQPLRGVRGEISTQPPAIKLNRKPSVRNRRPAVRKA